MKPNPVLASSIDAIPGPACIRILLSPKALEGIRPFFGAICRILTPGRLMAYRQEGYTNTVISVWVAREVLAEEVMANGEFIYEVRRLSASKSDDPRVVSREEQALLDGLGYHGSYLKHLHCQDYTLHDPTAEYLARPMFNVLELIDLPPDGYPLSETSVEGRRNIHTKRDPGSTKRHWAWLQRLLAHKERVEEEHANRILENEQRVQADQGVDFTVL